MTQSFRYVNFEGNIKARIKTDSLIDADRYYDINFMNQEWKKINSEGEKGIISLDTLIKGTCDKKRLLDLIENYILFTSVEGKEVKIL